jgi:RNA polymerase sigma factor (sigma-70 family)
MPTPEKGDLTPYHAFHTTRWSMVLSVDESSESGQDALAFLCRTYWYPLYAYVRRTGRSHHDAQDLTQGFFARLLEKKYLGIVSQEKGKFRSFLLCALKNYMTCEWRKSNTLKRGAAFTSVSMDEAKAERRYDRELTDELTPEALYDRSWAMALLDRTMTELETTYSKDGKEELFAGLRPYLIDEQEQRPYADTAKLLGVSVSAVAVATHRMRKGFAVALRAEISETVADPSLAEEELRALFSSFS